MSDLRLFGSNKLSVNKRVLRVVCRSNTSGKERMQCTAAYAGSQGPGVHELWRVILWCKADFEASIRSVSKRDAAYVREIPRGWNWLLSLFVVGDDSFQNRPTSEEPCNCRLLWRPICHHRTMHAVIATRSSDDLLPSIASRLCSGLLIWQGRTHVSVWDRQPAGTTTDISSTRPNPSFETQVRLIPIREYPDMPAHLR